MYYFKYIQMYYVNTYIIITYVRIQRQGGSRSFSNSSSRSSGSSSASGFGRGGLLAATGISLSVAIATALNLTDSDPVCLNEASIKPESNPSAIDAAVEGSSSSGDVIPEQQELTSTNKSSEKKPKQLSRSTLFSLIFASSADVVLFGISTVLQVISTVVSLAIPLRLGELMECAKNITSDLQKNAGNPSQNNDGFWKTLLAALTSNSAAAQLLPGTIGLFLAAAVVSHIYTHIHIHIHIQSFTLVSSHNLSEIKIESI